MCGAGTAGFVFFCAAARDGEALCGPIARLVVVVAAFGDADGTGRRWLGVRRPAHEITIKTEASNCVHVVLVK